MTFGGSTYGGSAYSSTATEEQGAVFTRASATASANTQVRNVTARTTANAVATATTRAINLTTPATTESATATATTIAIDATLNQPQVEWQVTRDGEFAEDTVFDVDPVVDTANPFGDYCVIKMDDSNGEKFANYARGTRVDVAVSENAGITFENRFVKRLSNVSPKFSETATSTRVPRA